MGERCVAYCYFHILRQELQEFYNYWNSHYIRKPHGSRCPPGVPNDNYALLELTGKH